MLIALARSVFERDLDVGLTDFPRLPPAALMNEPMSEIDPPS